MAVKVSVVTLSFITGGGEDEEPDFLSLPPALLSKSFTRTLYIATLLASLAFSAPVVPSEEGSLANVEDISSGTVGVSNLFAWLSDVIADITARVMKINEHDLNVVRHGETGITSLLGRNGVCLGSSLQRVTSKSI